MGKEEGKEIPEKIAVSDSGPEEPGFSKTELVLLNLIAEIIVEIVMQHDDK